MKYDKITIDRLPSGSYRYRVRDTNAKRYESATFKRTEEDAKRDTPGTAAGDRWAKNQLARYQLGQATAEPAAIGPVVQAYLGQLGKDRPKERQMNKGHVEALTRVLNDLALANPGLDLNRTVQAKGTIRSWLLDMKGRWGRDLIPSTRNKNLQYIKAMTNWAVKENIIDRDPAKGITVPQNDKTVRPVLTIEQARKLVALGETDSAGWLWTMLMLYAGMRAEEAQRAKWENILWDQNLIKVVGKFNKMRLVPLQPELREILMPLGGPQSEAPRVGLIVRSKEFLTYTRVYRYYEFRRVLKRADIDPDLGVDPVTKRPTYLHPHTCRHTYGSMLLASGLDSMFLQLAMGHEQKEMTKHYAQSATMFRSEIEAEGWKPGELRLKSGKAAAKTG